MGEKQGGVDQTPRMLKCLEITLALALATLVMQAAWPSSFLAVTLYKAHLMALGGWGGYWLDRALFPYARPHTYLEPEPAEPPQADAIPGMSVAHLQVTTNAFPQAMLRRAIIVAACLICVGLGA